ncbi:MAG TPA: dUTP diphosphatase [Candidatus Onthocola gallistercoris]|uniref:Deoxyuridine 5'-triphosphate nucleotidohydrolase n=1 Tax=Candidatus Onthocola gallistercoris TaxID=2840876 RepID=A0A9D1KX40_9FIRM|nr:dUTP diphosphatase [Candidatus Onthocola gallistercoris]
MLKQQVKIKKLKENAILPTYGTPYSAGADLYACMDEPVTIAPGETVLIKTGLAMAIPEGYAGLIYARSGLATKKGLAPANKVGVVDADYRGEVMVPLHNHSRVAVTVEHGERIAQMVITPFLTAEFLEAEELDDTLRGENGFGSTGR